MPKTELGRLEVRTQIGGALENGQNWCRGGRHLVEGARVSVTPWRWWHQSVPCVGEEGHCGG